MEKEAFIHRLVELRQGKNVSARDMSLSLGQNPGYINGVENGVNLPSMTMFFYICDYLKITPKDFFDLETPAPGKVTQLSQLCRKLSDEQLDHLIALVKDLR